jgi:carbonic anhydrase/acetyltransferase-like protein (isoleucine patch superfamily)
MSMRRIDHAWIADTARVIGDVTLGRDVSLWYGAAVRGDVAPIEIGDETNVQDNVVIHVDHGRPNRIGSRVTLGHGCICHGERIGDGALIGMGATLLGRSRIGVRAIVAAGSLVPEGMEVPDEHVAMGVPAKVVRPINDREREYIAVLPPRYVEEAEMHWRGASPLARPWTHNPTEHLAPNTVDG